MYTRRGSFQRQRFHRGGFRRGRGFQKPDAQIAHSKYVKEAEAPKEQEVYTPKHTFADFPFDNRIKRNIEAKGYVSPTPIQDEAIEHVMNGSDVVALANTGTGKTAAFLLPTIHKILNAPREKALVLVPTRELAVQVYDEFRSFSKGLPVYAMIAIGGAGIVGQIKNLKRNPHIVIATPGRLKDLINRRAIDLSQFRTVVLDEVDRMVDIGFLPDVRFIVDKLSHQRQSLFFSATVTPQIEGIIHSFAKNPVKISVRKEETAKTIDQNILKVTSLREKLDALYNLADSPENGKMLVFVRTKHGADNVSKDLFKKGFGVSAIHGNKSQFQRTRAITDFKCGKTQILIATDIAARGIDIPDISLVVNFDEPATYADYVHRIGRTGRAGKTGRALTFILGR